MYLYKEILLQELSLLELISTELSQLFFHSEDVFRGFLLLLVSLVLVELLT